MNKTTTERILWIDFAKVLGIWLVYLGHSKISPFAEQYIYAFHMPLFFFISGYLERERGIGKTIIHNVKTLIIPYFLFYILLLLTRIASWIVFHSETLEGKSVLIELFLNPLFSITFGLNNSKWSDIFSAAWFLITLFYIKTIHAIIIKLTKEKFHLYLLCNIPMIIGLLVLKKYGFNTTLHIVNILMAFPFFSSGYYIKKTSPFRIYLLNIQEDTFLKSSLAIMFFLIIGFMSKYNGLAGIHNANYGKNILVYYVTAMLGISLILILSTYYKQNNNIIQTLSSGTLFLMALEAPFRRIVLRLSGFQDQELGLIVLGGVSTVAMLLTILPIKFVQKYIPVLLGGRVGSVK